jgi:hypothetical protein
MTPAILKNLLLSFLILGSLGQHFFAQSPESLGISREIKRQDCGFAVH